MRNKIFLLIALPAAVLVGLVLAPLGTAVSQELQHVRVTNFPDPQRVEGTVTVKGPIRAAELVRFSDVTVSPVRPEDTTRLIHAGTLNGDGYGQVVLSLVAQARGTSQRPGSVGAILVPDEAPARQAFLEEGKPLVALRLDVQTEAGPPRFFGSRAPSQPLAFPRYQVFLYNTTDTTVTVTLYGYLSSG